MRFAFLYRDLSFQAPLGVLYLSAFLKSYGHDCRLILTDRQDLEGIERFRPEFLCYRVMTSNYRLIWDFRFAYRELAVLLRNDPTLQARYRELRQRGYASFADLIEAFAAAGVLTRPKTSEEQMALTDLCWIVSEQWPVDLELRGQAFDEAGMRAGVTLMRHIFLPYMAQGRDETIG